MTTYRVRLDTTTNWAVGTTAAITTLALGASSIPHYSFALPFMLVLLFLWMEARRYLAYELVRQRVRLLEQGFLVELLRGPACEQWQARLAAELANPTSPLTYLQAISVRLRRSYLWLFFVIYLIWLAKLHLVGSALPVTALARVPGLPVILLVGALLVPLVVVALSYRAREEG